MQMHICMHIIFFTMVLFFFTTTNHSRNIYMYKLHMYR